MSWLRPGFVRSLPYVAVVVLAAAARLATFSAQSLDGDELFTRKVVAAPFAQSFAMMRQDLVHPPLYYLGERIFYAVAGDSPLGLRLLSLLAGLSSVGLAMWFLWKLSGGDSFSALTGGVLLAVSPEHTWCSQYARSYALYALLVLSVASAVFFASERQTLPRKLLVGVLAVLAVLTHYIAAVFVCSLALVPLFAADRRSAVRAVIVPLIPAALGLAAWAAYLWPAYRAQRGLGSLGWNVPPSTSDLPWAFLSFIGVVPIAHGALVTASVAGAIALWLACDRTVRRRLAEDPRLRRAMATLLSVGALPVVGLWLGSRLSPFSFWTDRYLLPALVFVILLVSLGLGLIRRSVPVAAYLGAALCLLLAQPWLRFERRAVRRVPYDEVARFLRENRRLSEPVATTWPYGIATPVNYYLGDAGFSVQPFAGEAWARPVRVGWLLYRPELSTERRVADDLTNEWRPTAEHQFGGKWGTRILRMERRNP